VLCIDVDKNPSGNRVLEVGLAWQSLDHLQHVHIIVRNHLHIRSHLPGYDCREHFQFGRLELLDESKVSARFNEILESINPHRRDVIVMGHSIRNDIAWLHQVGVRFRCGVCDIAKVDQSRRQSIEVMGLRRRLDRYRVHYSQRRLL
jgi:hypothetical protein